ncbi:MAG: hypothetical protein QNJ49_11925 [Mastigocoleus sp. MO_167.B18]|nr:hypothetical protein [Mastigocoleus sp. MO_167.B18]
MSFYQYGLEKCREAYKKIQNLSDYTISLSDFVYSLHVFHLGAFEADNQAREIERNLKLLKNQVKSANDAVEKVKNQLESKGKITQKEYDELKKLNEIIEDFNETTILIESYLDDILSHLSQNSIFGAFLNLINRIQVLVATVTIQTIELGGLVVEEIKIIAPGIIGGTKGFLPSLTNNLKKFLPGNK